MDSSTKEVTEAHYYEETQSDRLSRKIKESPFMPVGIAGLVVACGIGAYGYKNRGKMSTSVYLMRLRVIAQGTVVGCLTLGVAYAMFQDYFWKPTHEKKSS